MSDPEISHLGLSDADDAEVAQYQAVSGLAVVALIVGLVATLAMVHYSFWFIPPIAILLSLLAQRQIAREVPPRIGRKAARVGLVVSVFSLAAGVSAEVTHRLLLESEARRFAAYLFQYLRQDEPYKAYQLCRSPAGRKPLNNPAWNARSLGEPESRELQGFVSRADVKALLRLGDRALVRHYLTERLGRDRDKDEVELSYAVTYDDAGQKKSFFVRLTAQRSEEPSTGHAYWQIELGNPVRPESAETPSEHDKT